jgi:hypothetical protein
MTDKEMTDKEIIIDIINKKGLPFCNEVYELADEILKYFKLKRRCEHCESTLHNADKCFNLCNKCVDLLKS